MIHEKKKQPLPVVAIVAGAIVFGLVVLCGFGGVAVWLVMSRKPLVQNTVPEQESDQSKSPTLTPGKTQSQVTIYSIMETHKRNPIAAKNQYEGQRLLVVGEVFNIFDQSGQPVIIIDDGNYLIESSISNQAITNLRVVCNKKEMANAAKIKTREPVLVEFTFKEIETFNGRNADDRLATGQRVVGVEGKIVDPTPTFDSLKAINVALIPTKLWENKLQGMPIAEAEKLTGPPSEIKPARNGKTIRTYDAVNTSDRKQLSILVVNGQVEKRTPFFAFLD